MGILNWASQLRFRNLFFLTLAVFALDLFLPDPIPLVDEIFLGLLTLLLGSARKSKNKPDDPQGKIGSN